LRHFAFRSFPLLCWASHRLIGVSMAEFIFRVNGSERKVHASPGTPLLWVLRDTLQLTGTKFGCGAGLCGACTVHVEGEATRSCSTPLSQVAGKNITTIEGLSANGAHPLQVAWIAEEVPQCGYCQSGQIMAAAALLAKTAHPTEEQINSTMSANLCRCGTYERIRRAIQRVANGGGAR
jgi:isoquinoline 1-oxidoreductase subunit alpha